MNSTAALILKMISETLPKHEKVKAYTLAKTDSAAVAAADIVLELSDEKLSCRIIVVPLD